MSPELLDPEAQDHHRTVYSDCYALGMVIYEVLSERTPFYQFYRCSNVAILWKILKGVRPERPTGTEGGWFTDDVWELLGRCWMPQPEGRPNINDIRQCLEKVSRSWTPALAPAMAGSLTQEFSDISVLRDTSDSPPSAITTINSVLTPAMSRDFLTLLFAEFASHILSFLPFASLARASRVCKAWRNIIDSDHVLWRDLLKSTKIWFGGGSERAFSRELFTRRRRAGPPAPNSLPGPHPYKILFKSRHLTRTKWINNLNPKHVSFPAHGRAVVTCLIFSHERIISASDDHSIHVYSPHTGQLTMSLDGHEGGVWALSATKDVLVSGSTDRTVRIWDLNTGRCTHVFGGHTSTVRCLAIVKPEWVETTGEDGVIRREKWPKRPMIVTGSRDHTLRVWLLPRPDEDEYRCFGNGEDEVDPAEVWIDPHLRAIAPLTRCLYRRTWTRTLTTNCIWRAMNTLFAPSLLEDERLSQGAMIPMCASGISSLENASGSLPATLRKVRPFLDH